jgi:hypothetical protein
MSQLPLDHRDPDLGTHVNYYKMQNLRCTGSEPSLTECLHDHIIQYADARCHSNKNAVGVTCKPATTNVVAVGQARIGGFKGSRPKEGETLSVNYYDLKDSDGIPEESTFEYQWIRVVGEYTLDTTDISAATDETYELRSEDVDHNIKVKISFTDKEDNEEEIISREEGPVIPDVEDGTLRLLDNGRLEIFDGMDDFEWKGICDDSWSTPDAQVACRQLGFSGGVAITRISVVGAVPFLLDEVACSGTESKILDCGNAGRGVSDCAGYEYAGVTCSGAE